TEQQLRFVASQSPEFQKGYAQDQQYAMGCAQTLLTTAANVMKDPALQKELEQMFMPYLPAEGPNQPGEPR
ncbi:MAG: hypothetical protein ABIQ93_03840, partial [Saprospiraceae bacterium]